MQQQAFFDAIRWHAIGTNGCACNISHNETLQRNTSLPGQRLDPGSCRATDSSPSRAMRAACAWIVARKNAAPMASSCSITQDRVQSATRGVTSRKKPKRPVNHPSFSSAFTRGAAAHAPVCHKLPSPVRSCAQGFINTSRSALVAPLGTRRAAAAESHLVWTSWQAGLDCRGVICNLFDTQSVKLTRTRHGTTSKPYIMHPTLPRCPRPPLLCTAWSPSLGSVR